LAKSKITVITYKYVLLVGKPEGNKPLRSRWTYNIKIVIGEIVWARMGWTGLAQNRDKPSVP
jgi:hypothetical protein